MSVSVASRWAGLWSFLSCRGFRTVTRHIGSLWSHVSLFLIWTLMHHSAPRERKEEEEKKHPETILHQSLLLKTTLFLYTVYISTFIYIDFLIDLVFFSSFSASCWLKKGKKTKKQEPLLNLIRLNTFFPLFSFILFFFWTETQNSERIRDNVSLKKKREKEESFLHIQTHICTEDYSGSRTSQYS